MDERALRRALTAADGLALAALTGLLFCVYLLTASLTFVSDDEMFLFDATESIARHGSIELSETADLVWPGASQAEPIQPLLAAGVYWLANSFDGVGNVHATLLFNPLVTALTGSLVFLCIRQLSFSRATALAGGLAFGLSTIAWPYAKTFFREPLATLTLFATAYALLRWRDAFAEKGLAASGWLAAAAVLTLISILTKEIALFGVPLLLLILLPQLPDIRRNGMDWLRIAFALIATIAAVAIAFWLFFRVYGSLGGRFDIAERLSAMIRHAGLARDGLMGFVISPGKSLFIFSPMLVLALAAPFIGDRRQRLDTAWPLILLAAFIIIYAFVRGIMWWGGTNWGPRYMVPVTPFLIVACAPLIEAALHRKGWLLKIALAALFALGVAVQIGAVAIRPQDFYDVLGSVRPDGPWTIGLWDPYYSAVLGHWRLMGVKPPDFAWVLALPGGPAWTVPILTLGLSAVFVGAMGLALTRETIKRRAMLGAALGGFIAAGAVTWFSLRAIYYDQRYKGNNEELHQLNAALKADTSPDPIILLNNRAYFEFMLNYYKGHTLWYTLELNPNELLAPDQPPPPPSTDPLTLLNNDAHSVASNFARLHQTTLLIMEHGPFTPESPRPMEWWMTREFYYAGVQEFGPAVRLVRFSTASAAPAFSAPAAHPANYRLGDTIALIGWDASPEGRVRPGSVLNISTQWQAVTAPGADYKIGAYLITPDGAVAAQDDSFPVNGFWPTISWGAGEIIRHNIAFALPHDMPPGFYEVWTLMYSAADGARLQVQDSSGTTILDHIALFTIEVTR
ncbi:MAG: hypothetical protein FJ030_13400 [Chloroflexi bacterium]|nr:hypothetical protein [Chloroflexota bacterium]